VDQTLNEKLAALRAELELDEASTPNAYRIGTVRTWKSGRFKKTATGWVPVSAVLKKVANAPKGATGVQVVKSGGKPPAKGPTVGGERFAPGYTKKAAEYEKATRPTLPTSASPFGRTTSNTKTFINTPGVVTYMPKGESSPYGGFRRLAGLVDDRVLEAEEVPAVAKYADNPAAYNTQLAKLMAQLKRDKNLGVTGVRQGYKGTGSQAHKRQIWVKVPSHERGGPDVWLEGGFVRVGGIIDIPKSIPNTKKYGDESPEQVYNWIADTLKKLKAHIDAKYANNPAIAKESVAARMAALLEADVANMSDEDVVKTARALASKGRKGKLSPKEAKDFKTAMQRIKDEGLLSDDDQKDIWQWHGGGGQ
jgi:hypothetical protein